MIDPDRCKKVVHAIRELGQNEIDELFKLLYKEQCLYTKTIHGIFVNLSWVSEETMQKIEQFINFCQTNDKELTKYETLCDVLNHKLYDTTKPVEKETKITRFPLRAKSKSTMETEDNEQKKLNQQSRVSSSMRFYLLKKRFSKPLVMTTNYENDLMPEDYIVL